MEEYALVNLLLSQILGHKVHPAGNVFCVAECGAIARITNYPHVSLPTPAR